MSNERALQEYSNSIRKLKKQCTEAGITDDEFRKLYYESLDSLEITESVERYTFRQFFKKYRFIIAIILIIACITYNFKSVYSCIICNLQDFIYPGLRLLRRLSIPFISLFPALTDLYHETCLIQNPFFTVVDMDCWPCSSVNNIRQVADPKPLNQQYTAPFIYETEQQVISTEKLKVLYDKNKHIFDKEAPKILTNNKHYISAEHMFTQQLQDKNYYIWKFNNMNIAKLLRQIIPRPKVVPKFGQSTERFIIVDTSQQSFHIPDTECSFSFLLSLSGSRIIELIPAEECKHQCKILKVELKETYLLWYNWWYWRPVVQSSMGNNTFVAHVGSYC